MAFKNSFTVKFVLFGALYVFPSSNFFYVYLWFFENDTFQDNGPAAVPDHKRVINPNKRGGIIGGYAYSVLIAGGHTICTTVDSDVMQEIEGNAIANGSQAWNSPFVNEMRRKTITRRHFDDLLPVLNLNVELEPSNIHAENSFEAEYARHGK